MSSSRRWRIEIRNIVTHIRVGIHPHEKEPQRVLVNVIIEADYARDPQTIGDCFDYEWVYRIITKEWPQRPHVALLEHYVRMLLHTVFNTDTRVAYARVNIAKADVFPDAESAGVGAEWTRADFEQNG